jgi:beta-glucosidase
MTSPKTNRVRHACFQALFLLALLSVPTIGFAEKPAPLPYQDTKLGFEERTRDLVGRLTLQEKVDLLNFDSKAIGRLGIPAYNWWNECLHGVARSGIATVFPQAIGMAAMWDTEEMLKISTAISDEARAKYQEYSSRGKRNIYQGLTYWTPNINLFRDPRWGRGMETYGEDPYLTGEMAVPFVKGLQGNDPKYLKLVATAKHFAVHSGPEPLRHSFDVWPSKRDMAETYTPHFEKVVKEAGVYSVMCAYNAVNGAPCCGNKFLEELLRKQWGFQGYIVSDCGAIQDFVDQNAHHIVKTKEEAAALAVKAGTDLNCGSVYPSLMKAVEKGLITEQELNVSVARLLLARMKLGQFDPDADVPYTSIPFSVLDCKEHKALALDAARKSMVLLKNDKNTLPLNKGIKKLAVIGPNADDMEVLLGNYNGFPSNGKTPLAGLREKLPQAQVAFAQGCPLAEGLPYFESIPSDVLYTDSTLVQHGLKAEYFDNRGWKGEPKHIRVDANVDFTWVTTPPFADLPYDQFSARWTGVLMVPETGSYALGGEGFSGFNLWLNDSLLVQYKHVHHPQKRYEFVTLEAGKKYHLRLEYYQHETEYATMRMLWDAPEKNLKQQALDLAKNSDAVVLCMGLSPMLEGEEMKVKVEGFSGGDRLDIKLPAIQTELIREITALGKPTVLVLLNGSALAFPWEKENIPAIVEAWYPGQAGGIALADVLFGDYNPSGRLPLTFYESIDQIPPFKEYDMTGKTYRFFKGNPMYEFGYGLSYTSFEYSDLQVAGSVKAGKDLRLKVTVSNTGKTAGDEVAQLYVSLPDSKFRVPVRSLQGFRRVNLQPGESKVVEFVLKPDQMAAFDENGVAQIQPGKMLISVGGKQPDPNALAAKTVLQKSINLKGVWFKAD